MSQQAVTAAGIKTDAYALNRDYLQTHAGDPIAEGEPVLDITRYAQSTEIANSLVGYRIREV